MTRHLFVVISALAALALSSSVAAQPSQTDNAALREFTRRVAAYVELRQTIVATLPRVPTRGSAEEVVAAVDRIRVNLQFARLRARRGDIFVAEAAPVFRALIRRALADEGIDPRGLVAEAKAEVPPDTPPVVINRAFPLARQAAVSVCLLAALPPLPVISKESPEPG